MILVLHQVQPGHSSAASASRRRGLAHRRPEATTRAAWSWASQVAMPALSHKDGMEFRMGFGSTYIYICI